MRNHGIFVPSMGRRTSGLTLKVASGVALYLRLLRGLPCTITVVRLLIYRCHCYLNVVIDTGFNRTFLVTFKSFTTLDELFDGLVKRFYIIPPADLNPNELKEWTEQKQQVVRFR